MKRNKPRTVLYRRKRTLQTDYRKRLKLLVGGLPRIVVRVTNTQIIAQLIVFEPQGDRVLCTTQSSELQKLGWLYSTKNVPAAYLTGLLFGTKAIRQKQKEGILDIGLRQFMHGGRISAFVKGVVDAGMDVPVGEDIFPSAEKIQGKHIQEFMIAQSSSKSTTGKQFAQYLKNNLVPQIAEAVQAVTKKIKEMK